MANKPKKSPKTKLAPVEDLKKVVDSSGVPLKPQPHPKLTPFSGATINALESAVSFGVDGLQVVGEIDSNGEYRYLIKFDGDTMPAFVVDMYGKWSQEVELDLETKKLIENNLIAYLGQYVEPDTKPVKLKYKGFDFEDRTAMNSIRRILNPLVMTGENSISIYIPKLLTDKQIREFLVSASREIRDEVINNLRRHFQKFQSITLALEEFIDVIEGIYYRNEKYIKQEREKRASKDKKPEQA